MAFISKHNLPTLGQRQKKQNLLASFEPLKFDKPFVNKFFTNIPSAYRKSTKFLCE